MKGMIIAMALLFESHLTTINNLATPVQTFNESILFVQVLLSCSAIFYIKNQKVFNGGKTHYFELSLFNTTSLWPCQNHT